MEGVLVEEDLNGRASTCGSLSFLGIPAPAAAGSVLQCALGGLDRLATVNLFLLVPAQWMARTGCASSPWFNAG